MTAGARSVGEFCWINVLTAEPARACTFFGDVLHWKFGDIPGLGYSVQVGGRHIGGLFDLAHPSTPPGTAPVIGVMVKVESADATCERVVALGGTARPAFDIGEQGRMAVCHDPAGAQFDVWEPRKMPGTDVDSALHGAPSWFESLSTDVERASAFYRDLFGWRSEAKPMQNAAYTEFTLGDRPVAGMMAITPKMEGARPHWETYFSVDDADESARVATALGGTVTVQLHDIPGVGRSCGLRSPQGVSFRVIHFQR